MPFGKVQDFSPYVTKIKASGAQSVITGNYDRDLNLLIKAGVDAGPGHPLRHLSRASDRRPDGDRRGGREPADLGLPNTASNVPVDLKTPDAEAFVDRLAQDA